MAEIERDACKKFNTSVRFLKQVWMKQFSNDSLIQTHQQNLKTIEKSVFDMENPGIEWKGASGNLSYFTKVGD